MRIVSLLPAATEILCALGLEDQLVGVTHECDYPPSVQVLPRVTRTLIPHDASSSEIDALVRERLKTQAALYSLDQEVLEWLQPDLLVTQALCDVCAVAESEVQEAACRLPGQPRVLNLEPMSLRDVFETLRTVGRATRRLEKACEVVEALENRVAAVTARTAAIPRRDWPRVAFLEWIAPPFSAGHWNPALIEMAGGVDILGISGQPSRSLPWEEVVRARPDVLFVSCCGYAADRALQDMPFLKQQPGWASLRCVKNSRVFVSDGNAYFSRPGPRLVDSLEILAHALHPSVHPLPAAYLPFLRAAA